MPSAAHNGEDAMPYRGSPVAAIAVLLCLSVAASAQEAKKYAAFEGMWDRGSPLGSWIRPSRRVAASRPR